MAVMHADVKWSTRQRLQFIEILAWYTGVVTRSAVARAFGNSDAAATKDLKLYNDLAPGNLVYNHNVFGFVPHDIPTAALPLPARLPNRHTLAQITRAIHRRSKLRIQYRSLSDQDSVKERILEPHTLVDTGLRWHMRAYQEASYDFRDFVLSRISEAECLDAPAESNLQYDDDWVEYVNLRLAPHAGLDAAQRDSLLLDYGANDEVIEISVRRALLGYLLQRLNIDTTPDHSMNPNACQLMLLNRDEIEPFAAWAFR